jgi:glycosyltransferase involved in cell wall biosynthesis
MRVAQIIDAMKLGGGAERLQLNFAEAVRERSIDLSVLTLGRNDPEMTRELQSMGVEVAAFPASSFHAPMRFARFLGCVRRGGFDILHTHLVRSTLLGSLAGRLCGIPVVSTIHNTKHNQKLSRVLRWGETRALRIAVGWQTAEVHAQRLHPRNIDVIPNAVPFPEPVSASERESIRHSLGASERDVVLVSVGRLHPQKGYGDLIQAFKTALAQRPELRLWILGGGVLKEELQRSIADPELRGRAQLLGLRTDVPRILSAGDLYVSAAHWEGLPVSILEAMSAGLGVVATSVGDVSRIVDERNGRLVTAGAPTELATALEESLSDPSRMAAWGREGSRRALEEFGLETWADRTLDLYEEVIRGASPSRLLPAVEKHRGLKCG